MSKADMYANLHMAEGNDLIDERNRLIALIARALEEAEYIDGEQIVADFEEIIVELTKRESA